MSVRIKLKIHSARVERITPTKAKKLLEKNLVNRNLRGYQVAYLTQLLLDGEFDTTHQGIALDSRGRVIDGQHRLEAIIASGVAADVLVVRYANAIDDPTSIMSIDNGAAVRSLRDITGHDQIAVSIARVIITCLEKGDAKGGQRSKASPGKVNRMIAAMDGMERWVTSTTRPNRSLAGAKVAVLARMLYHPKHAEEIGDQYSHWVNDDRKNLWPAIEQMEKKISKQLEAGNKVNPAYLPLLVYNVFNPVPRRRNRNRIAAKGWEGDANREICEAFEHLRPALAPEKPAKEVA